jgi:hypothetical protein
MFSIQKKSTDKKPLYCGFVSAGFVGAIMTLIFHLAHVEAHQKTEYSPPVMAANAQK